MRERFMERVKITYTHPTCRYDEVYILLNEFTQLAHHIIDRITHALTVYEPST
jgi:hypothetical protein